MAALIYLFLLCISYSGMRGALTDVSEPDTSLGILLPDILTLKGKCSV